jgi:AraC family transcriptional regulator
MLTNAISTRAKSYAGIAISGTRHQTAVGADTLVQSGQAGRVLWQALPNDTVHVAPANSVKRRSGAWTGMSAEIVQVAQRGKLDIRFRAPVHLLVLHEEGARSDGETHVEGGPKSSLRHIQHKLTFVPAGHVYCEWHDPRILPRMICVYIDPAFVPVPAGPEGQGGLCPKLFFENAAMRETALKLASAIEAGAGEDTGYLEALGAVLVHELARLGDGAAARQPQARGGLAGWQQRAVTTYIEEHLDQSIPLAKLAELARLSPYYFCRAFKESFGVPPHRYHTNRRIDRAKAMLTDAAQSVTEIGFALGFSETSSFTTAFRKTTGTTPTAYRRSLV